VSPVVIAQLTDLHIADAGVRTLGGVDSIPRAEVAAAWLTALDPRPDLVLLTGDIGQNGTVAEYVALRRIFAGTGLRIRLLPGNHDDRDAMRTALGDTGWVAMDGPFIQAMDEVGGLVVFSLDSLDPGKVSGRLCDQRLDWLGDRLGAAAGAPALVALHHPPFASGLDLLDGMALDGREALGTLIRRGSPTIKAVLCGHLHRPLSTVWAGTLGFAAPSSGRPFGLSLAPGINIGWSDEAAGAALHWWTPQGGLVSHVVAFPSLPGPADTSPEQRIS
jgi:Icc protein